MSISVEYNNREINQIVIENTLKMIERRKLITSWAEEYKNLGDDINTKSVFTIRLNDNTNYSIYLVNAKLSSIVQATGLDDYLANNIDIH